MRIRRPRPSGTSGTSRFTAVSITGTSTCWTRPARIASISATCPGAASFTCWHARTSSRPLRPACRMHSMKTGPTCSSNSSEFRTPRPSAAAVPTRLWTCGICSKSGSAGLSAVARCQQLSASGLTSLGRKFHFELDAELIVYGATEPDAQVTLQGEPVHLRSDGTFTVRFSLPDSRQIIPAVASPADGSRGADDRAGRRAQHQGAGADDSR